MASERVEDLTEQFRRFVIAACNTDPGAIVADGRWHRFRIADTRHRSSRPGRYLMHADGKANGIFMDWRDGVRHKWFGEDSIERIDRSEINRRREQRAVAARAAFAHSADQAASYWAACTRINGSSHPYLDVKGIAPHGTRYGSGEQFGLGKVQCVVVPLYGAEGSLVSLQAIRADGERRFWPRSSHEGSHFLLGTDDGTAPVIFCEGFSTAASLAQATGNPVVMCVTSGNMPAVARWASHRWAGRDLIVAGDDDWHLTDNPKVGRNVGRDAATGMAKAMGARLVMPDMSGLVTNGGDDFNDMAREFGLGEVAAMFRPSILPKPETALPLVWYAEIAPILNGNWIIKKFIPSDAFVTIIGHPGCGKSFLALDVGCHIGAGLEWQGRKTKKGLVIYLAAEGQRGQMNRVHAWRMNHEGEEPAFAMIPVAINLRDREADVPNLIETIRAAVHASGHDLSVLIVDTLNRTFGGGDENGSDMSEYVENVGRLKSEFGCTAIVVHHIPKNAEGTITERGHGSLRGAIEASLVVSYDQESGLRTVTCTKMKDAEDGWSIDFKLKSVELGHDEDGEAVTSCVVVPAEGGEAQPRSRGPMLSPTQRQVYNELLGALEAAGVGVPRDIPDDQINRVKVGKVVQRAVWRSRYIAIVGDEVSEETAAKNFRRAVTDLQNKGLVGAYNDHAWATHK